MEAMICTMPFLFLCVYVRRDTISFTFIYLMSTNYPSLLYHNIMRKSEEKSGHMPSSGRGRLLNEHDPGEVRDGLIPANAEHGYTYVSNG